jgi:hypothetical protein
VPSVITRAKALGFSVIEESNIVEGPDNYNYKIINAIPGKSELFVAVGFRVSSLKEALEYWVD